MNYFYMVIGLLLITIMIEMTERTLCSLLQRMHFRNAYGLSVQRMLAESPIDRTEVRRLAAPRDRRAQVKAAKYVTTWDPVPFDIAMQFVFLLCAQPPSSPSPNTHGPGAPHPGMPQDAFQYPDPGREEDPFQQ
ncbi:hypothetical protein [uncultured Actinomyces sp.]|uniref:hypothetical protein n=1 Tax=uncultured Actinomyces sp. TaxID=249061 RepID=UPI0026097314|nr:hypothetical protein [uncultured Actinomyces sp.]